MKIFPPNIPVYPSGASPVSIRLNEREVREQAVVCAAPDGQGVVPPVGIEDVHHAAEAHGLQRAKAELDRDPLHACAKLHIFTRPRKGGVQTSSGMMMMRNRPLRPDIV